MGIGNCAINPRGICSLGSLLGDMLDNTLLNFWLFTLQLYVTGDFAMYIFSDCLSLSNGESSLSICMTEPLGVITGKW